MLVVLLVLGVAVRLALPYVVVGYVNRTLDRNPVYDGHIGKLRIHLWRGAYSIQDVRLLKTTGNVPVPFISAKRMDFALQWSALLRGRFVARLLLEEPQMNFVADPAPADATKGEGLSLDILRDLFPFRINRAVITRGSIHFRAFHAETPWDVHLTEMEGTIENLANVNDDTQPLLATVRATALAMDHARFELRMTLDPFAYRPTFHLGTSLLGLDVTKLNDLARAYGGLDFERGWFDFIVDVNAKEGLMSGYAKPLFRNLKVFSFAEDLKDSNPLQFFLQALAGATVGIFKNQPRDQFGTLIPFTGDLSNKTTTDLLATIGNVLRNAFIRAYLPRLERGQDTPGDLEFGPAEFTDALAVGEPP